MNAMIINSWKIWLIGLILIIMIPTTLWLGIQVIAPQPNYELLNEARAEFFEGYSFKKKSRDYDKLEQEWQQTEAFDTFQAEQAKYSMFKMMICGPVALILFEAAGLLHVPIISPAMTISALLLTTMQSPSCPSSQSVFGISFSLLELLFGLIDLFIVLKFAYRTSKK